VKKNLSGEFTSGEAWLAAQFRAAVADHGKERRRGLAVEDPGCRGLGSGRASVSLNAGERSSGGPLGHMK
jgi:hypothetical protein